MAATSNMPQVSCQPCILTSSHDTVDSGDTGRLNADRTPVLKRHSTADRGIRARSYPPAGKSTSTVDDWFGLAPLASPETLSESSSLASCGCGSSGAVAGLGYQRIMSAVLPPRMDPILQSPARSSNSRDCCLYLESADVVGDLATLSPCVENLPSPLAPRHRGPDIVPSQPLVILGLNGSSSTVAARAHSPDVVQETRSTTNAADLHAGEQRHAVASDMCRIPSVESGYHADRASSDISCSCERGACVRGSSRRPDIVSTHDCGGAAGHDILSTDD